jgi:hypothetical protein
MTTGSESNSNINVYSLFVAWLLGIVSALLVYWIKQLLSKRSTKIGIKNELNELQMYLVAVCFIVTYKRGNLSRDFVVWIRPYYNSLLNSEFKDFFGEKNIIEPLGSEKLSDNEFFDQLNVARLKTPEPIFKSSLNFPKIISPYIDSKMDSLSFFKQEFQILLSKFKREIHLLNNDIEQTWFYHAKTFENLSEENHEVVNHNLSQIYFRIAEQTSYIVKLIDKIQAC